MCISLFDVSIVSSKEFQSFYVSNTGNDANDGLSPETAWQTIRKANSEMNGGVINRGAHIYFKRGDIFSDATLSVRVSGISMDYPTTIGAYGKGEKPVFRDISTSLYCIYIGSLETQEGYNNITIENLVLKDNKRLLGIFESKYIILQNMEFYNGSLGTSIRPYNNISHFIIRNCIVDSHSGDNVHFKGASYVLIENNTFINAHHTGVTFYGHYYDYNNNSVLTNSEWIIIRNNEFIVPRRAFAVAYWQNYTLFENNHIQYIDSKAVSHGGDQNMGSNNLIYRYNTIRDFRAKVYGDSTYYDGPKVPVEFVSIYHNTMYTPYEITSDGFILQHRLAPGTPSPYAHNISVMNNIIYAPHENNENIAFINCPSPTDANYSDMRYTNNIILVGESIDDQIIRLPRRGSNYYYNITTMESDLPFSDWVIFSDNLQVNPLLNNDLSLKSSSPAIDAGTWLTSATESKTSIYIYVDKAQYFWPRVKIHNLELEGDNIFVGSNRNLEVISVDYENNIIEVNKPITYKSGDIVSLSFYNGNATDIGAYEFNSNEQIAPNMLMLELLSISNKYDSLGPLGWIWEDVNRDGIVNVLDLVIVSIL